MSVEKQSLMMRQDSKIDGAGLKYAAMCDSCNSIYNIAKRDLPELSKNLRVTDMICRNIDELLLLVAFRDKQLERIEKRQQTIKNFFRKNII
jgi:hypothetical protein